VFVQFDCGCIGISIDNGDRGIILSACDEDRDAPRDSLGWAVRDMEDHDCTPLSPDREADLHARLAVRLSLADRFDGIVTALGLQRP